MSNKTSEQTRVAAVDVGGTFTDLLVLSAEGLLALKVPSTPRSPELGVLEALETATAGGVPVIHGSTVATNSLLERKGARTAFITTEGFADIIEIGRQERPHLYRLDVVKPEPLVSRRMRFEAEERVAPGGEVIKKLSRAEASRIASRVAATGAASAAVCLLFSFEHPAHEELIGEELEKLGVPVSLSSRVLPEYREYERGSSTVINAYVSPVMERYLDRLEGSLSSGDGSAPLRLMHSAGGTVSADAARSRAVDLILSGPAGGVVAARWLGESLETDKVISFDMGGTSTDVSLIDGGLTVTRDTRITGLPVAMPMIDIHTIGAGGGSLAHLDDAGVLKVGPRSAGADPGPACYGRGTLPTVTDANLVLGRLEPDWFLGGKMKLDRRSSVNAFQGLAGGGAVNRAAAATLEIALSHMEAAVKKVSLERGHDPREFALVAFGGAGPMHACELAERLEIPRVIIPVHPGLFSSMGMLLAEPGRDFSRTFIHPLDDGCITLLGKLFNDLKEKANLEMAREGFTRGSLSFRRNLEMRYRGQSHQVEIPVERLTRAALARGFEDAYRGTFGYLRSGHDIEVVNVRLSCRAPLPRVSTVTHRRGPARRQAVPLGEKRMIFGKALAGRVYSRAGLAPGHRVTGPSLIVQEDTTTVVPPGWRALVDRMGNLELVVGP